MTRLGFGCARLGSIGGGLGWRESIGLVQRAIDRGITYFDTADAYGAGTSERLLGEALRGRRATIVVATKGGYRFDERSAVEQRARAAVAGLANRLRRPARSAGGPAGSGGAYAEQDFSPTYLTSALDGSLRRLGLEQVDVYQLHGPRVSGPNQIDQVAAWGERMIASGKIGRLGVGAEDLDQARQWSGIPAVSSMQVPYGMLDPEAGDDVIPAADAAGCCVVVRGVLGAGLLGPQGEFTGGNAAKRDLVAAVRSLADQSGVSVVRLALGFVRARPEVDVTVVGAGSAAHIDELAAAGNAPPLDDITQRELSEIVDRHRSSDHGG